MAGRSDSERIFACKQPPSGNWPDAASMAVLQAYVAPGIAGGMSHMLRKMYGQVRWLPSFFRQSMSSHSLNSPQPGGRQSGRITHLLRRMLG